MNLFNSISQSIAKCYSIDDLRTLARYRLPKVMFDYIDGGSENEVTLSRNSKGFERYQLVHDALVDVSEIDMSTTIQGADIELPFLFSPTGSSRLFHHKGELATSSAAKKAGTIFTLSSMSNYTIEEIGAHSEGTKWFQIYVWKDRSVVKEFIQRCKDNGYHSLCLTVDVPTLGQRERDLHNGMTIPPKFTLASLANFALHPSWCWHILTGQQITMANVKGKAGIGLDSATSLGQYANDQLDPSVTWEDMAWMIKEWGGPFLIKGILSAADAKRAVEIGASGIIISNHGGRQLDYSAAPIDVLPEIVEAVGHQTEIILDGGIRRGTDVIKALALGADACMIGRAYLYGLAAGGEAGVDRAIELLRNEIRRSLMLLGCPDVKKLDSHFIRDLGK